MKKGNYIIWKNFSGESSKIIKAYRDKILRHGQGPFKIKDTSQKQGVAGELIHFLNHLNEKTKVNSQWFEEITHKKALKISLAESKK